MLFPTHAITGLTISLILGFGYIPLLVGSVIADLVDKPLGMMDVTSRYQTVFHSGVVVLPVLLVGLADYFYSERILLLLLSVGWLVHILSDMINMIVNSRRNHVKFVLWPFSHHSDPLKIPPGEFYEHYKWTRSFYIEIIIWVIFLILAISKLQKYLS